jgi:methionine-rich copper-binding protein CopC
VTLYLPRAKNWVEKIRDMRLCSLVGPPMSRLALLVGASAFLVSSFQPLAAGVDRSHPGVGPPGRSVVAAPAFELEGLGRNSRAPSQPRQRVAHAIVVRTSPEQSGVAPETIGKVEVWYDSGIRDDFAALAVIDAKGDRVDKRDAAIDKADQSHVSASVDALAPGVYTVRYRAMSADGHLVSGAWQFEVRPK